MDSEKSALYSVGKFIESLFFPVVCSDSLFFVLHTPFIDHKNSGVRILQRILRLWFEAKTMGPCLNPRLYSGLLRIRSPFFMESVGFV